MNETKKSQKGLIAGICAVCALVLVAVVFVLIYRNFSAKPVQGAKHITVEVVDSNGNTTTYDVHTDAEFLRGVMDELASEGFSYTGSESEYGLMIESINGERADYTLDNAYWSIYVNGEYGMYGADSQPVYDGDTYSWRYESAAAWTEDDAA